MNRFLVITLFVVVLFSENSLLKAQSLEVSKSPNPNQKDNRQAVSPEMKKETIDFLRETIDMAANLNSTENRVNYLLKGGDVIWEDEPKEGRKSFMFAMNAMQQLIYIADTDFNNLENILRRKTPPTNSNSPSFERVIDNPFLRNGVTKNVNLSALRNNLILTVAGRDPELAYKFLLETTKMISNSGLRTIFERADKGLENQIAVLLLKNNPEKTLEIARKRLKEGVSLDLTRLLSKIYEKDAAIGSAFAEEIVEKLKSSKPESETLTVAVAVEMFEMGEKNHAKLTKKTTDQKRMISDNLMRELAELMLRSESFSPSPEYLLRLEKYSPQISLRFKSKPTSGKKTSPSSTTPKSGLFSVLGSIGRDGVGIVSSAGGGRDGIIGNLQNLAGEKSEINNSINELGKTQTTPEQIEEDLKTLKQKIREIEIDIFRIEMAVNLAKRLAQIGMKEEALLVLGEEETRLSPQIKTQLEYGQLWRLTEGYADVEPDKAFTLLENGFYQLNEVITAYLKVNEFSAFSGIRSSDGEIILQNQNIFFSFSRNTLKKLAEHDFARTKGLADRFNQLEFRVETRMMIASAILNYQRRPIAENSSVSAPAFLVR